MTHIPSQHMLVLGLSPSSNGVGFAVLENSGTLVDWGVKVADRDKNTASLAKICALVSHYHPGVIVIEDSRVKGSVRAPRIKKLHSQIGSVGEKHRVKVVALPRHRVRQALFPAGAGTKHAVAELLAKRFPEELGLRLPPKRRPWMSEDSRIEMFDAVALCVAFFEMAGAKQVRRDTPHA